MTRARLTHSFHSVDDDKIGPLEEYNALIASGSLKDDDFQRTIIESLQAMHDRLMNYTPEPIVEGGAKPVEENTGLFSKVRIFLLRTRVLSFST